MSNGFRIENSAALLCSVVAQLAGNKHAKVEDFLPRRTDQDDAPESLSIGDMFKKAGFEVND